MKGDKVLLITGGREYDNGQVVADSLRAEWHKEKWDVVIHGWANGADTLVHDFCSLSNQMEVIPIPFYSKLGKGGGHARNRAMIRAALRMAELGDIRLMAFPGNSGTRDMKQQCRTAGIRVIEAKE